MKCNLSLFTLLLSFTSLAQNRIDFGIEAQVNQNKVKKWDTGELYTAESRSVSVLDIAGDTLDIYFNNFSMANTYEIPLYFRLNRNRHFIDVKLSNSFNTLKMDGVANYNNAFFEKNYGTYSEFETQAIADGFTSVDSLDYQKYIEAARDDWETKIAYTEQFQLLSIGINYGYRFLPHKSIKPFISSGFSVKGKYRKVNYDYLDFSNEYIRDLSSINSSINKFAETSFYWNAVIGVELYRFRMSAFFQTGFAFNFPLSPDNPENITYRSDYTAFDQLYSYGFTLGLDLFRQDFGNKIHLDEVTKDELEESNIKRTKDRWDLGIRFKRRGFNELSTFFKDSAHSFSLMTADTVLFNTGTAIQEAQSIQVATFGDIKRIGWSAQFDAFGTYHFGERWCTESSLGYSALNFDVETTELTAVVAKDSSGNSFFVESASSPKLRSGVYRKAFHLFHLSQSVGFKVVNRDIFDLRINLGFGLTVMAHRFQILKDKPAGVNGLKLYERLEDAYYYPNDSSLFVYSDGPLNPDLNESPDEITGKFSPDQHIGNWTSPRPTRAYYPTVRFGVSGTIDRFIIGIEAETTLGYMDGFMLNNFSTIYFSIAYKIFSR